MDYLGDVENNPGRRCCRDAGEIVSQRNARWPVFPEGMLVRDGRTGWIAEATDWVVVGSGVVRSL